MNTKKYDGRLPMLRCSQALEQMLVDEANALHISLAEAHRQALARGLMRPKMQILRVPIVGEYDQNDNIHFYPEAA